MAKINYWQTMKWQRKFPEVKDEILQEDFSAKKIKYLLARHILLDNIDEVVELLPTALNAGELKLEDINSWPLFRSIRKNRKIKSLLSEHKEKASEAA